MESSVLVEVSRVRRTETDTGDPRFECLGETCSYLIGILKTIGEGAPSNTIVRTVADVDIMLQCRVLKVTYN